MNGRGESFKAGGVVVKNVTGFDLCKLAAGSWGTLFVLTEVTLRTEPKPESVLTLLAAARDPESAAQAAARALGGPDAPVAAAIAPPAILSPDLGAAPGGGGVTLALRLEGRSGLVEARADRVLSRLRREDEGRVGTVDLLGAGPVQDRLWGRARDLGAFALDPRPLWRVTGRPRDLARAAGALPTPWLLDWAGGLLWAVGPSPPPCAAERRTWWGGEPAAPPASPLSPRLRRLSEDVRRTFDPAGILNRGRGLPIQIEIGS